MPANSFLRRALKQALYPVLNGRGYLFVQAAAKAWDIWTKSGAEPEMELIPFAVKEGDTVLDIGANYGFYSYPLSRAVGSRGSVYAFEPVPFVHETLHQVARILRFKNVTLIPKGCSDETGQVSFTLPIQASGAISGGVAHMGRRNNEREGKWTHFPYEKTDQIQCEVVALDGFLEAFIRENPAKRGFLPELSNLSFIKCDIEGAELLAFRGAKRLISQHCPTVLCEINPWFLEGFGIDLTDLVGFFSSRGYGLYRYEVNRLLPTDAREVVEDNYLFIHPRYHDRFAPLFSGPSQGGGG